MKHQIRLSKHTYVVTTDFEETIKLVKIILDRKYEEEPPKNIAELIRHHLIIGTKESELKLETLARNYLPAGSGFDDGTRIDVRNSSKDLVILHSKYHHMDEHGFYCGWSQMRILVRWLESGNFDFDIIVDNYGRDDALAPCMKEMDLMYWDDVFADVLSAPAPNASK